LGDVWGLSSASVKENPPADTNESTRRERP
jgi:hypothetical protein